MTKVYKNNSGESNKLLWVAVLGQAIQDITNYKSKKRRTSNSNELNEDDIAGREALDWINNQSGSFNLIAGAANTDPDRLQEMCLDKVKNTRGYKRLIADVYPDNRN